MGIQKRMSLAISGLLVAGGAVLALGAAAPAASASTTVSAHSAGLPSLTVRARGHHSFSFHRGHHRFLRHGHRHFLRHGHRNVFVQRANNCCCDDFDDDFDDFDDFDFC